MKGNKYINNLPTILFSLVSITFLFNTSCNNTVKDYDKQTTVNTAIIPVPKTFTDEKGYLLLKNELRIVINEDTLIPYAEVFSDNLRKLTSLTVTVSESKGSGTEIFYRLNTALDDKQYKLKTGKKNILEGGSIKALVNGSYSLLQMINPAGEYPVLPAVKINDKPDGQYRGLMIDLARNWHDVPEILKLIDLAAYYKLNYVQLHFTDYQSYTLPSKVLPCLSTPEKFYSFDELKQFEEYARLRGIDIIPEIDIPGHAMAMINAYPDLFGIRDIDENPYTINIGKEEVYEALEKIIGETANIFPCSPYFHIGGDEAIFHKLNEDPDIIAYMSEHNLDDDIHELYRHFIIRINEIIKAQGKQMCVWEGFRKNGKIEIPRDILVFEYESAFYLPCDLINDGYTVVNASWKPLYVVNEKKWSPEYIYNWNMWRWENWFDKVPSYIPIQCDPSPNVIGGQMCAWEQKQELEFPSLRQRVAAFSERIWNTEKIRTEEEFMFDLLTTDELLSMLVNDFRQDTLVAFNK